MLCRGAVWEEHRELSGEGSGKEGIKRTLIFSGLKSLLQHLFICHRMGKCHYQAAVLLHCLADDLVGLGVPRPAAPCHLQNTVLALRSQGSSGPPKLRVLF